MQFDFSLIPDGSTEEPVRKGWIPVHIFSGVKFHGCILGEKFQGSGTLILGVIGEHRNIITAEHLFPKGTMERYYYRIIRPPSKEIFPLQVAKSLPGVKKDVAICRPGKEMAIIPGFSENRPGPVGIKDGNLTPYLDPLPHAIHLLSGNKIPVIGHVTYPSGECYCVLAMESFPGDSGSGLIDPGRSNTLYILKGVCDISKEHQERAKFLQYYPKLSLAALVEFAGI